jgi:hypothetical protein
MESLGAETSGEHGQRHGQGSAVNKTATARGSSRFPDVLAVCSKGSLLPVETPYVGIKRQAGSAPEAGCGPDSALRPR